MLGAIPSSKVREYMEKANIFIATSDQNEGWGAVVNEAMNSACAIVANKKIGSVPYLINNGENGLIYSTKKEFIEKTEILINSKEKRNEIGCKAYETITNIWNSKVAVKNLIDLIKKIQKNDETSIENGPGSKAKIIL